jgi:carboxylesterase
MSSASTAAAGTKPGAETIDLQEGNSHGILLLHGFGDTPQTLGLLARHLHDAGFDVKAPLLPGHGRSVDAFMTSTRREWLACGREELARMRKNHRSVSIGGLSMGGAIAAILAAESTEATDIESLVLIAPYLDMPVTARIASATHWIWGRAAGVRKSTSPRSILDPEERKKNLGYGAYTGRLLYELWRIAAQARRALRDVTVPTLLIQSKADPRIAPSVAERAFATLPATEKKLSWAEGGGHIITVDFGREKVFDEITGWIVKHQP